MSNPFQPVPVQQVQPVQAPAPVQTQAPVQAPSAPVAGPLDQPLTGFNTPLLPHCVGMFSFDVVGLSCHPGAKNNPHVHITLKCTMSNHQEIQPNITYRVMCAYDYDYAYPANSPFAGMIGRAAPGDEGLQAAKELQRIVACIFNRDVNDQTLNKTMALQQLRTHDFDSAPGRIQLLVPRLRPGKKDPTKFWRDGTWLPGAATT